MACDCVCGGEYSLSGRSGVNGFERAKVTITKLSNFPTGATVNIELIYESVPGSGATLVPSFVINTPVPVTIGTPAGMLTSPLVITGPAGAAIPDGAYLFKVYDEDFPDCFICMQLLINTNFTYGVGNVITGVVSAPGYTHFVFAECDSDIVYNP